MVGALRALRALRALLRDTSGAVAIIVVFALPILVGATGLAVDVGYWYLESRGLQSIADGASYAGVIEKVNDSTDAVAIAAAKLAAERSGLDATCTADPSCFVVNIPPTGGPNGPPVNNPQAVEVIINQQLTLFFSGIFLDQGPTVPARAVGAPVFGSQNACIVALDPDIPNALTTDSNATITAIGCAIQVNSTNPQALQTFATPTDPDTGAPIPSITADGICVTGDFADPGGQGFSTPPLTGAASCPSLTDPLASRTPPPVGSCDFQDISIDNDTVSGSNPSGVPLPTPGPAVPHPVTGASIGVVTLEPGVYCGGITLDSDANVVFNPGTYTISGGQFRIDSNSNAVGNGVGFFLTGNPPSGGTATINFDSNSQLNFVAPATDPATDFLSGLIFFEDRDAPLGQRHELDSNGSIDFEGSLYFPRGEIHIDSNGLASANSPFTQIIARTLTIDSNAKLTLNNRLCSSGVPPPCSNVPNPPGITTSTLPRAFLSE